MLETDDDDGDILVADDMVTDSSTGVEIVEPVVSSTDTTEDVVWLIADVFSVVMPATISGMVLE